MLKHIRAARAAGAQRGNGNIITGTVCTMLAMLLFAVMNTGAKLLTGHHVLEIGFYRNLFGTVLFGAIILWQGKIHLLKTANNKGLILGRSVIGYLNLAFAFSAFQALPMANTQTLLFTGSLLAPLLGFLFLGERIGRYRYAVIISGFAGVCLIAGPTAELSTIGVIWALLAALCQAAQAILLRHMGKADSPLTISFWFMAIGTIMAGVTMPWVATVPNAQEIAILAALAVAGSLAQLFLTYAYAHLQTGLVSALNYVQLIWVTLFGWVLWGTLPTPLVVAGAGIIVGGNLFILWREQREKAKTL